MDQVYFCPICGYITNDSILTGPAIEKNVFFVARIYRERAKTMTLFGRGLMTGKSAEGF